MVQFLPDGLPLFAKVSDILAAGMAAKEPLVVISAARHRASLEHVMGAPGATVPRARDLGHLTWPHAAETVPTFLAGDLPDDERFRRSLGRVLETTQRRRPPRTRGVTGYAELVDLLRKQGKIAGALRAEELWSEAAMLCAWALGALDWDVEGTVVREARHRSAHVMPADDHGLSTDEARALRIALLEHRTMVLEDEIEQRKQVERRLRDALHDRIRAEAALRESTSALRARLADREAQLERERRARLAAEQANRAKSEFLAVMSHEFRTPLNAIAGHIELVELGVHGTVTDAQGDALRRAQRSQRHLLSLINALLNLARTESGQVTYRLEQLDPGPLLAEVVAMVEPLARAKRIRLDVLSTEGSRASARMRGDPEKVQQILLNVLTNAIKFTPEAGRITIDVRRIASHDGMAIVVHDSGIGIPPDKLESIFQPFVQLAMDAAGQREGFGLGLAISRDLARGMGGNLEATSTPGDGATFTLTLPGA